MQIIVFVLVVYFEVNSSTASSKNLGDTRPNCTRNSLIIREKASVNGRVFFSVSNANASKAAIPPFFRHHRLPLDFTS
jgi:hypothetical protein